MKITAITTVPVSVPIDPARVIRGARGTHATSPFLLVQVRTDEGLVGLGEVSCTPGWSGEDSRTAAHAIAAYLEPQLRGRDPGQIELLAAEMDRALTGHRFTKAAVEMALWDLLGKAVGLPVYRLLGGPVRASVRTKFSVAGVEPERAAEIARWACEQGFTAMKVKVGTASLAADLERVAAVRSAIGPEVLLGVDGNGGWTRAAAKAALEPLARNGVAFIEQPVPTRDLRGLAEVRRAAAVPVVADESVGTPDDALAVVEADAADILSIYVGMAGGLAPARRVAAVANAAGLGWTIGSNLELGIGLAAHIHLAASTPGLDDERVPCDIISTFYYQDDLLAKPLPIRPGSAGIPDGSGLGVELDDEKVEHYREDR